MATTGFAPVSVMTAQSDTSHHAADAGAPTTGLAVPVAFPCAGSAALAGLAGLAPAALVATERDGLTIGDPQTGQTSDDDDLEDDDLEDDDFDELDDDDDLEDDDFEDDEFDDDDDLDDDDLEDDQPGENRNASQE